MKASLFNIANFKADGGAMFGVVPKVLWSRVYRSDENNLVTLTLRSLIVETAGRKILVDTGWGDKQDEKFFRYVYLHSGEGLIEGLKSRGYKPEDITDVVLTHLHADHCGGTLKNGPNGKGTLPVFPNATIHVSRAQYDWAVKNNLREADAFLEENILPLSGDGKLNLIDSECDLCEGFSLRLFYGHTPGLMLPLIDYKGRKLFYTGDLIPTVAHIPLIWNMAYDIDQLRTIDEKQALLKEALDNDYVFVFQHDENVECCSVGMTEKGIRAKDKFGFDKIV